MFNNRQTSWGLLTAPWLKLGLQWCLTNRVIHTQLNAPLTFTINKTYKYIIKINDGDDTQGDL